MLEIVLNNLYFWTNLGHIAWNMYILHLMQFTKSKMYLRNGRKKISCLTFFWTFWVHTLFSILLLFFEHIYALLSDLFWKTKMCRTEELRRSCLSIRPILDNFFRFIGNVNCISFAMKISKTQFFPWKAGELGD